MSYKIRKFETISQHQAKLSQPPTVIKCLISVLQYVKEILDDDGTQTLFQMIEHHLNTKDHTAHHINLSKLNGQIFAVIRKAIVSLDEYETIPEDPEDFFKWLLSNPEVYDGEDLPEDYDAFATTVTIRLVFWWMSKYHDRLLNSHTENLSADIDNLFAVTHSSTNHITHELAKYLRYALMGEDSYDKLIALIDAKLAANPPTEPIIDYWSHLDLIFSKFEEPTEEDYAVMSVFLEHIYEVTGGVVLLQFDTIMIQAVNAFGGEIMRDYVKGLSEYGEDSIRYYRRKYLDYYANHLDYVLSDSMEPSYRDLLSDIRGNVNTSYYKALFVPTILNRQGYSINIEGSVDKLTDDKTLDLLNLVGLSKSIVAVSLESYVKAGQLFNRMVISFDNYNPNFTDILAEDISKDNPITFKLMITINRDESIAQIVTRGQSRTIKFSNKSRMFKTDPYYLFIPPKIDYRLPNTIRISMLRIYGRSINDEGRDILTRGFQHN